MRRSNHENIHVLMMIGLVTGEGEEGGKSHSKVGTRWVRQLYISYICTYHGKQVDTTTLSDIQTDDLNSIFDRIVLL